MPISIRPFRLGLAACMLSILPVAALSQAQGTTTTPTAPPPSTTATEPLPPPNPWTLAFAGDTLLTRRISSATDPFAGAPLLGEADLTIVNLETAVATGGVQQKKTFTFLSSPILADKLSEAGVDVVSLANNHTLDYGPTALTETLKNLDRVDVGRTGAGRTLQEALTPAEYDIEGTSVAVLAASQIIPNEGWPARPNRPGIVAAGKHVINTDTQRLLRAVREAKQTNDVVVVVMHWGIEGSPCPSAVQRTLGKLLRDAGATAVLGAHPHILQPIVPTATSTDNGVINGVIVYSMGNFIWDPRGGATGDTGVITLGFTGSKLTSYSFAPHRLDGRGWARAVAPSSALGKRITARVENTCPGAVGDSAWAFTKLYP